MATDIHSKSHTALFSGGLDLANIKGFVWEQVAGQQGLHPAISPCIQILLVFF